MVMFGQLPKEVPTMVERRRVARVKSKLSGVLEFNGKGSPIECRVLAHSAEGATAEINKRAIVPVRADFTIKEMNVCHRSTVIRRSLNQIVIRYEYPDAETTGLAGRPKPSN